MGILVEMGCSTEPAEGKDDDEPESSDEAGGPAGVLSPRNTMRENSM